MTRSQRGASGLEEPRACHAFSRPAHLAPSWRITEWSLELGERETPSLDGARGAAMTWYSPEALKRYGWPYAGAGARRQASWLKPA